MSLRRWPDGVPPPLGRGYALMLADTARRTEFEVAVRARRITAARRDRPTLAVRLTDAEFEALRAWWGDEPWSLAGASDSLAHWTLTRMTRLAAAAVGPDAVVCDALAETAETGEHRAEVALAPAGWADDDLCAAVVSILPRGRTEGRIAIRGRDGVLRGGRFDLATGALRDLAAGVALRAEPHRGWTRLRLVAPVGTGAEAPRLRVNALADGALSYAGTEALEAFALGQIAARRGTNSHFVPCGPAGAALGAAGGAAWFRCEIGTGGGLVRRELLPLGPLRATPLPGLAWEIELPTEARDA